MHSSMIMVHILVFSLFVILINPFCPIDLYIYSISLRYFHGWKQQQLTVIILFLTFSFMILGQYSASGSFFARFTIIFLPLVFHLLSYIYILNLYTHEIWLTSTSIFSNRSISISYTLSFAEELHKIRLILLREI